MLAKLSPRESLLVLLAVFAAILVAHRFAPGAVALVTALSGTVVASLLRPPVSEPPSAPPAPPSEGAGSPPPPSAGPVTLRRALVRGAAIPEAVRGLVVAAVVVLGIGLAVWALAGCGPRTPAQAETAYTTEQSLCVTDGHRQGLPLSAVRECREASDRRWGVELRDGGR